jgi:hypothetical protein
MLCSLLIASDLVLFICNRKDASVICFRLDCVFLTFCNAGRFNHLHSSVGVVICYCIIVCDNATECFCDVESVDL